MDVVNLAIFYGGKSPEHEVSIISAVEFMQTAVNCRYNIIPVYIALTGIWYTGTPLMNLNCYSPFTPHTKGIETCYIDVTDNTGTLKIGNKRRLFNLNNKTMGHKDIHIDCACIIMHGAYGEDGSLQGFFEIANIPYTSTGIAGSAIGLDKILLKQFLNGAGYPVLESTWISRSEYEKEPVKTIAKIETVIGYPVFVKPSNLGSSIGISKVTNYSELPEALTLAFSLDRRVLLERALDNPVEVNCAVIGYDDCCEASTLELIKTHGEVLTTDGKYIHPYEHVIPAPLPEKLSKRIQSMSEDMFRVMDCKGIIRIDYMIDMATETVFVTEVNTIPGSMAHYLWTTQGIKYEALIDRIVCCAIKAHEDKNKNEYVYKTSILFAISNKGGKHIGGKVPGNVK